MMYFYNYSYESESVSDINYDNDLKIIKTVKRRKLKNEEPLSIYSIISVIDLIIYAIDCENIDEIKKLSNSINNKIKNNKTMKMILFLICIKKDHLLMSVFNL